MTMKDFKKKLTKEIRYMKIELSLIKPTPLNYNYYVDLLIKCSIYEDILKEISI